jgi:hypothetical protein
MGSKSELFSRAARCERLMKITSDPMRKEILQQLREMWLALADESKNLSWHSLFYQFKTLEHIEAQLEKGGP